MDRITDACTDITTCNRLTQYESAEPTLLTDRVCPDLTICDTNSEYETKAPTTTSDRECAHAHHRSSHSSSGGGSSSSNSVGIIIGAVIVVVIGVACFLKFRPQSNKYTRISSTAARM